MDLICRSPVWGNSVTWNADDPDLTDCFQSTALVWALAGFLLLATSYELWIQASSRCSDIPWNSLNLLKLVFLSVQLLLLLTFVIYNVVFYGIIGEYVTLTNSHIILCIIYLLVFFLITRGRKKGIQSSGSLFFFWLFHMICSLIMYRSFILKTIFSVEIYDLFHVAVIASTFLITIFQFLLCCWADHKPTRYLDKHLLRQNTCPEDSVSVLSALTFNWINPIILINHKNPLSELDLWSLVPRRQCASLWHQFQGYWREEISKSKSCRIGKKNEYEPSIVPVIVKTFWPQFLAGFFLRFMTDLLMFAEPQILSLIISFMTSDEPLCTGVFYAVLLFTIKEVRSLLQANYVVKMYSTAIATKSSIIAAIYAKVFKLSNEERRKSTVGEIVNLMAVDTQKCFAVLQQINILWSAPFHIFLSLYFLWNILGPSVLTGTALVLMITPFNGIIVRKTNKFQIKNMKLKDERTKIMNEILNGIKVLKLYAWENPFIEQVLKVREKEVKIMKQIGYLNAVNILMWNCASSMIAIGSFVTFIFIDEKNVLTPNIAFVSISLFNLLRQPLTRFPQLFSSLIQSRVAINRLNKFLGAKELDKDAITHDATDGFAINIEEATFSWDNSLENPVLKNISLKCDENSLVAVIGKVGAGKSSLISALLGELHKINGCIDIKKNVAYVPQIPWIRNTSVKSNIIMYNYYDAAKYKTIINACGLRSDLEVFPDGDNTEIGEKGINLSGGQKQRISLARAVYHDADLYLLDDPLSAVDSHVGKHIFDHVIGSKGLLNRSTRLMVTHSLTYLPQCNNIVVMDQGMISEVGSYHELIDKDGAFSEYIAQYMSENANDHHVEEFKDVPKKKLMSHFEKEDDGSSKHAKSQKSKSMNRTSVSDAESSKKSKLITAEEVKIGSISWRVYYAYAKSMGIGVFTCITLAWSLAAASATGSHIWLSRWSTDPVTSNSKLRDLRMGIYGLLSGLNSVFIYIGALGFAYGTVKLSNILHGNMLQNVMRTPMSFFDTTPIGRIINRFSKDVHVLDADVIWDAKDFLDCICKIFFAIIVISSQIPMFCGLIIPILITYYYIQKFYIASFRQLKRLELKNKSPIYAHFSETLTGASSIRGYKLESQFIDENNQKVDSYQRCYFISIITDRWLNIRMLLLGNGIVLFVALFSVLSKGTIDAGAVGLALSCALFITQDLTWLVRVTSMLETDMVSAERMFEYCNITEESAWCDMKTKPKENWPPSGKVEISQYSTRYRDGLDLVLKDITCHINPLEKIGICGRTGAGKSSLALALFRIIESAEGAIFIDGIDISTLGLHDLRSKLTIIPQDPVLFSGTLKRNLDPFEYYTESNIWEALEHAHLKPFVDSLKDGLQYEIAEGGENLSVGQRQLICLARALLRKTKLLILDEATAAVDLETDDLIQSTIRTEFKDCTIITIAHRLNTIMDNSRVMVLVKGGIAEFDTPSNLLRDPKSIFYSLAKDAGLV